MALSFNMLGRHGRLGNQMFQYAALRGIAAHHNYEFLIPPSSAQNEWIEHQLLEGFELFSLPKENIRYQNTQNRIEEFQFHFDGNLYETCPDYVDLFGYFQTEKYFSRITDEIRKDFTFRSETLGPAQEFRNSVSSGEVISLHIRRGDYVNKPWHGCCSLSYYESALNQLNSELPVIIFTDDETWARNQELFDSDRFMISEDNDNLFDMCLMSLCDYHIIANSSFSWWGAWLANSHQVFAPKRWFGPPLSEQNDTRDLIPESWKVL